jgi:hypothetical protein
MACSLAGAPFAFSRVIQFTVRHVLAERSPARSDIQMFLAAFKQAPGIFVARCSFLPDRSVSDFIPENNFRTCGE